MLKVVIADDEARILSLIRLLPDWDALGMEVAGTAGNGLEALALIERERPDILITSAAMPSIPAPPARNRKARDGPGRPLAKSWCARPCLTASFPPRRRR